MVHLLAFTTVIMSYIHSKINLHLDETCASLSYCEDSANNNICYDFVATLDIKTRISKSGIQKLFKLFAFMFFEVDWWTVEVQGDVHLECSLWSRLRQFHFK